MGWKTSDYGVCLRLNYKTPPSSPLCLLLHFPTRMRKFCSNDLWWFCCCWFIISHRHKDQKCFEREHLIILASVLEKIFYFINTEKMVGFELRTQREWNWGILFTALSTLPIHCCSFHWLWFLMSSFRGSCMVSHAMNWDQMIGSDLQLVNLRKNDT